MNSGWAGRTLRQALSNAALAGSVAAQVLLVAATVIAPLDGSDTAILVAAHLAVAVLALGVRAGRVRAEVFIVALAATIVFGISTTDSVDSLHTFSLVWMLNLSYSFPGFLLPRRRAWIISGIVLLTVPLSVGVVQQDWRWSLVASTLGTGTAIVVAAAIAVRRLDIFAETVDATVDESAREWRAVAASRASSFQGAERARVLHDTVINTLGAVARGGGATRQVEWVRDRCRRDIPVVEALLAGRDLPRLLTPLEEVAAENGVSLERIGLPDADLSRVTALVPDGALSALVLATREAIVNVGRHAGTGKAELHVADDGEVLVITVVDHGVGFDGGVIPGRGLAESVLARCEDMGIDVTIDSELGRGTRVEMRCPLTAPAPMPVDGVELADFEATVTGLRHRMALAWSAATVVVGVFIEVVNRPGTFSAVYGMLAIGAVCCAAAWWSLRHRDILPVSVQLLCVAAVPVAFVFAAAGADFARTDPIHWQAIGVTGPLVLLTLGRTMLPFSVGVVAAVVTAGGAALAIVDSSPTAAAIVLVGVMPALSVAGTLEFFSRTLESVGERAVAEQRSSVEARAERAAASAAEEARERWRHAGLQACLELLEDLASGRSDPEDGSVQAACAGEERYLRSIILLNPALHRMGVWLARCLTLARSKRVVLVIRTGDLDVDEPTAGRFGDLLRAAVESVPAGSEVTFSLFDVDGRTRLAVVGPGPYVQRAARHWKPPAGWDVGIDTHVGLDMVEVVQVRRKQQIESDSQEVIV